MMSPYVVDIPWNVWDRIVGRGEKSELEIKSQRLFHGIVVRELAADVITLDRANYAVFAQPCPFFVVELEFKDNP